jgi:hypothetical protein
VTYAIVFVRDDTRWKEGRHRERDGRRS